MTRKEFIKKFAEMANIKKVDAKDYFDLFLETFEEALEENDTIMFTGLGTFNVKETPSRRVLHPTTKEEMILPSKRNVKFKVANTLKKKMEMNVNLNEKIKSKGILGKFKSIFKMK